MIAEFFDGLNPWMVIAYALVLAAVAVVVIHELLDWVWVGLFFLRNRQRVLKHYAFYRQVQKRSRLNAMYAATMRARDEIDEEIDGKGDDPRG